MSESEGEALFVGEPWVLGSSGGDEAESAICGSEAALGKRITRDTLLAGGSRARGCSGG